jgi:hypothetical protein
MKNIDVFLIGAQKAGTTSVYSWLAQHPEISSPKIVKDYHFFCEGRYFNEGYEHLESFYKDSSNIKVHAAVNYLFFSEMSSKKIYDYNSQAKIIICLRDPVKRAISAYKYFVRIHKETLSLESALKRELRGELKDHQELANFTYLEHGNYSSQIRDYTKYFNERQIKIILFEDLVDKNRQSAIMRDLSAFIGVDDSYSYKFSHMNASNEPRSKVLDFVIRNMRYFRFLKIFLPVKWRRSAIRNMKQANISDIPLEVEILEETKYFLNDFFKEEREKIATKIGRPLLK